MQPILSLISSAFIQISAILVAVGWRLIIKKKREQHKKVMLAAAGFALAFFVVYVSRTFVSGNIAFGGPDYLRTPYLIFLWTHILLATISPIFGIVTITAAFREKFAKHRKIGRWTAVIWFITAFSGLLVYLLINVIYPGELGSIVDAVF